MNRRRTVTILAVIAALIGGAVGISTSFLGSDDNVAEATSLYIAPVTAIGPDAFSPSFATGQLPSDYVFELESGQISSSSESLYIQPRGTYGGPGSNVCDVDGMKDFFRSHPDRAAAWARIQGIEVGEIDAFLDSLNTAFLAQNVKLTMYGFKNGQEYGYEAIIKAGTAVLVDDEGLPRARCACGNPLVTDDPPPPPPTTTTTTEPGITITECPEGTTYYRTEDGRPQSNEPMVDEYVEIEADDEGFNPAPLDDGLDDDVERWEPTYDLCAPECPEYSPEEGEVYNDSWRYENGQWIPLFEGADPISDTRLLPGWTDDCGVCPPDPPSGDDAPPSRRYEDSFATWNPETEQWEDADGNPTEPAGSDGALTDPVDLDVDQISPELEQSLEDDINDDYDPCAPACPLDEYLANMPTWFTDPAGFSWSFDHDTGLWTPSNDGQPQADPPAWIEARLSTYAQAYDPNGDCGAPPACPPAQGSMAARYVVDNDGVMWTFTGGRWYSPTGEVRDTIAEFPGCSPCPADTERGEIFSYYDVNGVRWLRNAQGGWFDLESGDTLDHVWEIPGYLENCAKKECPEGDAAIDDVYIDGQGRYWRWTGDSWISEVDGVPQSVRTTEELPDCVPDEQPSADAPVTAVVACTYNTYTQQHQMRVLTEGLTSSIAVVVDDIPPNTVYTRVGNLFYRILNAKPTGVVTIRIETYSTAPIIYNHDVGDCMQPTPRSGDFGLELLWTCGFNLGTGLYEARGLAIDRGTPTSEIRSVTAKRTGEQLRRLGNTFTHSFTNNSYGNFFVVVELWDGAFNEVLADVGGCDDVLTPGWSRMMADAVCSYDDRYARNRLQVELTGANQEVRRVWDLQSGLDWLRTANSSNFWLRFAANGEILPNEIDLAVEMTDGFVYSFSVDVLIGIDGRCNGTSDPGADFGSFVIFACGLNGNNQFEVQVRPTTAGFIDLILKVNDSTDPNRYYEPTPWGYRAVWNPPVDTNGRTWITVELIDGRFNQYLVQLATCEAPLLETNAIAVEEPEEPIQFETTTTTIPTVATTTTTIPTVTPTTPTTTTTTTTTTAVANRGPEITSLTACRIDNGSESGEEYRVVVSVSDPDGDSIELLTGLVFGGRFASVTPGTRTVQGSGTTTFTVTVIQSNADLTIFATDGKAGEDQSIGVGSDATLSTCPS